MQSTFWFYLSISPSVSGTSPLGVTMAVILELPFNICAWISAAVIIVYTLLGGLYSVAYTDVVQLVLIFISLVTSQTHTHNAPPQKKNKNSRVQNRCLQEETKAFS